MIGNTSTDVEKTTSSAQICFGPWKHLHGRGEDLVVHRHVDLTDYNTSTDVEKT